MSIPRGVYVFYELDDGSQTMQYVYFDGGSWSNPQVVPGTTTTGAPALIFANNVLYCFHAGANINGQDNSNNLFYNYYDGASWKGDQQVPNTTLTYSPSVTISNGCVQVLHNGGGGGEGHIYVNVLYYGPTDQWRGDEPFSDPSGIEHSPGIITNANDQILCFYQGGSNGLYVTLGGNNQSQVTGIALTNSPAPIIYNGGLQCFYQTSDGSNDLHAALLRSDNQQLISDQAFSGNKVWYTPAICEFIGRLFCFSHSADHQNQLNCQVFVGTQWTGPFLIPNVSTLYSPAAIGIDQGASA